MAILNSSHRFYKNFYDPTPWLESEARNFCYYLSLELIRKAQKARPRSWHKDKRAANGILLLLFCWNFAAPKTKKLTARKIEDLLGRNRQTLKNLQHYSLKDIDKIDQKLITSVFTSFRAALGQTGATKALSLINPRLFVMWDTAIRRELTKRRIMDSIGNGKKASQYITFLTYLKGYSKRYRLKKLVPRNAILAKKLDEYHYLKFVLRIKRKAQGR